MRVVRVGVESFPATGEGYYEDVSKIIKKDLLLRNFMATYPGG